MVQCEDGYAIPGSCNPLENVFRQLGMDCKRQYMTKCLSNQTWNTTHPCKSVYTIISSFIFNVDFSLVEYINNLISYSNVRLYIKMNWTDIFCFACAN